MAFGQFPIRQLPLRPSAGTIPALQGSSAGQGGYDQTIDTVARPVDGPAKHVVTPPNAAPTSPHPAVARIIVPERDGISYGTGTLVDARGEFGLVVTNWHVIRDAAGQVVVEFPEGFKSPAQIVKSDKDWDLAALSIHRPKASPVVITAVPPQPGEWLMIAGYGGGDWRVGGGRCTQYLAPGIDFPHEMVELAAEARQGDSGGPIFNERGEMAGVLFGSGPGYTSGSYGGRVLKFLATVIPGGIPGTDEPPPAGVAGIELGSNAADQGLASLDPSLPPNALPPTEVENAAETPLLTPPPKSDLAARFGPTPLAEDDAIDPRVAVTPDRLASTVTALAPAGSDFTSGGPVLLDTSLADRVGGGAPAGDLATAPPSHLLAALWKQVGGKSAADQAKTVLAGVGLLALVILFWRMGSQKEAEVNED